MTFPSLCCTFQQMSRETSTTSVFLGLVCSSAHLCKKFCSVLTLRALNKDPPLCSALNPHPKKYQCITGSNLQCIHTSHCPPSSLCTTKVSPLLLTVDSEQNAGIAHPHHILSNTGKQEPIVLTGDVHQGQVDGMNIGPVEVGLYITEKYRQKSASTGFSPSCYCPQKSITVSA